MTSGEMTSIPGHFRSRDVIFLSRDCHLLRVTALRSSNIPKSRPTGLLQPLPVTSGSMTSLPGHFRSCEVCDVISCHVTATSHGLQSCRSSIVPKTRLIDLLQPLPGDFQSNDVTSGTYSHVRSCDVISCHITATSHKLPPSRSSNVPKSRLIGLPQPLPGDFRGNDVLSGHFRSHEVT